MPHKDRSNKRKWNEDRKFEIIRSIGRTRSQVWSWDMVVRQIVLSSLKGRSVLSGASPWLLSLFVTRLIFFFCCVCTKHMQHRHNAMANNPVWKRLIILTSYSYLPLEMVYHFLFARNDWKRLPKLLNGVQEIIHQPTVSGSDCKETITYFLLEVHVFRYTSFLVHGQRKIVIRQ
jgi:hypothetical protein